MWRKEWKNKKEIKGDIVQAIVQDWKQNKNIMESTQILRDMHVGQAMTAEETKNQATLRTHE